MLELVRKAGYRGILAGTRKTTPGLRRLEKMAAAAGGKHRDSEGQQQDAAGFDKITQSQRRFLTMGSQTSGGVYPMPGR